MRWIEYDYVCNANKGINFHKKIEYNEANLAVAQAEACDGSYTITEDDTTMYFEPVPIARGGTGANNANEALSNLGGAPANHTHEYAGSSTPGGAATSAERLKTARDFTVNLSSTKAASFDGSKNVMPGVSGTLSISNGGTGATTAEKARENLGAASTEDLKKLENDVKGSLSFEKIVNLHVWKKYDAEPKMAEVERKDIWIGKENGTADGNTIYQSISYADSIDESSLTLINPTTIEAPNVTTVQVIKGKYIYCSYDNKFYRVPTTATISESKVSYPSPGYYTLKSSVAYELEKSGGNLGYVVSDNESTYPENGEHTDGFWYVYHKRLVE